MSAAQRQLARGLESVGVGGGRRGIIRLLGNVLGLLGSRLLLVHVLWLLGSGLWHVLGLLGSRRWGSGTAVLSLEAGIVPALIVLTILVVSVEAGGDRGGGEVVGRLLLLHVLGSGRGSGVWWSSGCDGQVVAGGTESAKIILIRSWCS